MDYKLRYKEEARKADAMWAEPWKEDFRGDVWYNLNHNEISLEMLGDIPIGKKLLAVGARQWVERDFLKSINAGEIVRTDLIAEEGVMVADLLELPFEDNSFDIVTCREVIEHVEDEQKALKEIKRVLKPHGYLLITTPNLYNFPPDGTIHIRGYTPQSFLLQLKHFDFKIIKKMGNAPNIIYGIMCLYRSGFTEALSDFIDVSKRIKNFKDSYYIGTQLFVLARNIK